MPGQGPGAPGRVAVVVGVDGAGRTHRLEAMAAAAQLPVLHLRAPADPPAQLRDRLADAAASSALVLVDDVHRLGADALQVLAAAARAGLDLVVTRRPTIERPELAALDEALAARGAVEQLTPLDTAEIRGLVAATTGRPCSADTAAEVREASGGLPALAVMLAGAVPDGPPPGAGAPGGQLPLGAAAPPALLARVQRTLAVLPPRQVSAAQLLALGLDLTDDVLAPACGLDPAGLAEAFVALRDTGLLQDGTERLVPAVAGAVLADLPAGGRRRLHDLVARALVASNAPPLQAATALRAARARGADAAAAYLAAGEQLRFTDPQAAVGWFDDARDAGADPATIAPGAAEAGALLGLAVDTEPIPGAQDGAIRLAVVEGVVAAVEGRADVAAQALLAAGGPGPVLAVPSLVAVGRLAQARTAAASGSRAPGAVRLLATAAVAAVDPAAALPLAIEAAEVAERRPPACLLTDTPHALGAVLAVAAGDVASAVHLLEQATRHGVGGPVAADRHRLLLGWARLRAGLGDPAPAGPSAGPASLTGRDRMLHAALAAGQARRSGDIGRLRAAWPAIERVLARGGVDLFALEAAEELAVAAARLRRPHRFAATLAALEAAVAGLGSPPAWEVSLGWLHLQVAVAVDDVEAARAAAHRITGAAPTGHRQLAQAGAAVRWADALAGDVDAGAVTAAAEELAAAELPWEASRLAGDAAIRVPDAAAARQLLERARDLAGPEPASQRAAPAGQAAGQAGLSEREVEVARLVLAGRTHREIGAQLYIAPKTVEHHVARIRTKLGAGTRAEFVAALHGVLDGGIAPP